MWHCSSMIGSTASRYEFRGINHTVIIKWRIYEYTTRYDRHRCNINFVTLPRGSTTSMFTFYGISHLGIIKRGLYSWITYQIWSALMWCRYYVGLPFNIIGSTMSRYELQGKTALMKALSDMIVTECGPYVILTVRLVATTVSRYEFQDINRNGIIKWRLFLWKHYQIWLPLMQCGTYAVLTVRLIGSTVSRYEFQGKKCNGMIKWRLYLWKHYQIWLPLM